MTQPNPGFDHLIGDATAFLTELSADNSRDWWASNKTRYDSQLKTPAMHLLTHIAGVLDRLTGQPTSTKLFRPHRDLRFSRDKTPYHTHLHLLWSSDTSPGPSPGQSQGLCPPQWFFGVSPDYVTLGVGAMGFSKPVLDTWRHGVGTDKGAQASSLASRLSALRASGARISDPDLVRIPAPYEKDHPFGDLLRRKSLVVWLDGAPPATTPLTTHLSAGFSRLWPLQQTMQTLLTPA